MSKEILIHIAERERRVAILEHGQLEDFHIEVDRHQSLLGNIYKGRVESILPSINGAFVNIGQPRNGFLYLTDADHPFVDEFEDLDNGSSAPKEFIKKILNRKEEPKPVATTPAPAPGRRRGRGRGGRNRRGGGGEQPQVIPLKEGQEILVQVVKDPFGTKGARLTTHISLAGRFVVYMPMERHSGVSKKIEDIPERQRLKEILKEIRSEKDTGGFIVRTAAMGQGQRELVRDAKYLRRIWQEVMKLAKQKQAPNTVYKDYDLIRKVVRDYLTEDVTQVVIDSEEEFQKMRKFVSSFIGRDMVNKIQQYKGVKPLFEAKKVSRELDKIYDTKAFLKSGAYVVIEPTEGLIVVDVNSGKYKSKASPEDAAFNVNMEAAPEIARQLRLRDLGGIIVIDFIDMNREDHKRKVLEKLRESLEKDHSKTEVNRISSLGLVEMTRARAGKTVESIKFQPCPYCDGRGKVKID